MTLILEISAESQAELTRQAAARGMNIDRYAAGLLEEAAQASEDDVEKAPARDMVELFAPLRGLNLDFERDRDPGRDIAL